MILYELTGKTEEHPVYRRLEASNTERYYSFLRSAVSASIDIGRPFLSQTLIKAIHYHAIACLHTKAGEFRPCPVDVGDFYPPEHYRVPDLMDDFVNEVNFRWHRTIPLTLAAYVLWRLNYIHPFINGNGRTARAASYFVLCARVGEWLGGKVILPELLRDNRDRYIRALKEVDKSVSEGKFNLEPLETLIATLLKKQLRTGAV